MLKLFYKKGWVMKLNKKLTLIIIFALSVLALVFTAYKTLPSKIADKKNNDGSLNTETSFCGGIMGAGCQDGYHCLYDGNYPDASGKCVKNTN